MLLQLRKRKRPDPTITLWKWGLFYLLTFALTSPALFFSSRPQVHLAVTLIFFAFSLNITLGMLFKIFPFLIWFHRFSHLIGQKDIPMLGDLLEARLQFTYAKMLNGLLLACPILVLFSEDLLLRMAGIWLAGLGFWLILIFNKLHRRIS